MKLMKRILSLAVLTLCVVWAQPLFAQAASSTTLVGTVTDSSGAVVPGASIVAVQNDTHVAFKGQSNATGNYTIPFVAVGTYTITASHSGFANSVHSNVIVDVNQTVRTNFALSVGQQANTVTVTATPPPIQTDSATISTTTAGAAIAQLPVPDHDPLKLASTTAGVTLTGDSPNGNPPGETFTGPGARASQNDVTLDGVSVMNSLITTINFRPSQDSVQELAVQTGTYSAEYGGYLGVHINAVTKAGGNALHGALSEAVRNNSLDSRTVGELVGQPKDPFHYNQFGAELDGPVVLPGVYDGRNKTFFMFAYQGLRQNQSSTQSEQVLSDAERGGDFSALNGVKTLTMPAGTDQTCIQNNIIQPGCINQHALELLNFMPKANTTPTSTNPDNLIMALPSFNNWNQYITREDEVLNDNTRFFFRYGYQSSNPGSTSFFQPDSVYSPSTQKNFVVGYTQIVTPNIVNQFQLGRNAVVVKTVNQYYLDPSLDSQLKVITIPGFAYLPGNPGETYASLGSPYASIGQSGTNWFQTDETWTANDTLSIMRGAHNIVIGADLGRYFTTREAANNAQGNFNFDGSMTGGGGKDSAKLGDSAADFMLGFATSSTTPTVEPISGGLQWRDGFFVTDKWNASRNLTLNIGLRYELPTVATTPSMNGNVLNATSTSLTQPLPGQGYTLPNHKQFAPRVGFAYRIGDKWVARGGFGIYYNPNQTNSYTLLVANPPFSTISSFTGSYANPVVTFSNPTPGLTAPQPGGTPCPTVPGAVVCPQHPDVVSLGPYFPSATMNQWSFDVERTLWSGAGLDVQYMGNHSYHLDTSWYRNEAPAPGTDLACAPGAGTAGANYNPLCDLTVNAQLRRPNQLWGNIRDINNNEVSNYDGLNVVLNQRLSHDVQAHFAYTWSHYLDEGAYSNGGGSPMDPYKWYLDYGNSSQDIRHRLVGTYLWEMPFFRGSSNGFVRDVVAGWALSGVVTVQSGTPINVTVGSNVAGVNRNASQRPNLVAAPSASSCGGGMLQGCLNPADFATPTAGFYGTAGRNLIYGPGRTIFDTSLAKSFQLGERANFQIRGEAFNTFNHINWNNPNGTLSSSNFGRITGASAMRQVELGARLTF